MSPSTDDNITLLLVDDHPIVLDGLKTHLQAQKGFAVVATAPNGREALALAKKHQPDLILMDISMPVMNGMEAMSALRREAPASKVLVLTMHDNREYLTQVVKLGARGYLLKDTSPAELVTAIKAIHDGQVYLSPAISKLMIDELANPETQNKREPQLSHISDREREVLVRIAEGQSNKEIAAGFGVSVRTVETHRERIMKKLKIRSVAGLTKFAIAQKLIKLD